MWNLCAKGGNMRAYTTDHLWGPITCAVWNSNVETFDALVGMLPVEEVVGSVDSRGWTLLHFAAQNGCEYVMRRLLELGADPDARTVPTWIWVKECLDGKTLTAEIIATEYGHGEMWLQVIRQIHEKGGVT